MLQFTRAVCRIYCDQDQAGFCARKLGQHPLRVIWRPDADAITRLKPKGKQPSRKIVNLFLQFGIAPANVLMPHDQCFPIRPAGYGAIKMYSDGLAQQEQIACTANITRQRHTHSPLSRSTNRLTRTSVLLNGEGGVDFAVQPVFNGCCAEVPMKRRDFLKSASAFGGMMLSPSLIRSLDFGPPPSVSHVAFVKTTDRAAGVIRAMELLNLEGFHGKDLFIKPNFNSADATPGSTSVDTLAAIVKKLKAMGAGPLTIGDRSGMGNTREVMEQKHAFTLGKELSAKVVVFDDLSANDWEPLKHSDSHWQQGFAVPRLLRQAGGIV